MNRPIKFNKDTGRQLYHHARIVYLAVAVPSQGRPARHRCCLAAAVHCRIRWGNWSSSHCPSLRMRQNKGHARMMCVCHMSHRYDMTMRTEGDVCVSYVRNIMPWPVKPAPGCCWSPHRPCPWCCWSQCSLSMPEPPICCSFCQPCCPP